MVPPPSRTEPAQLGQRQVHHPLGAAGEAGEVGVVKDHHLAGGTALHVELHPVGAEGHRPGEGLEGVLGLEVAGAPVGEDLHLPPPPVTC